jgi:signal transduction histidine kinase
MIHLFSGARWRMVGWSMLVTTAILLVIGSLLYATLSRSLMQSVDASLEAASSTAEGEMNEHGETAELEQQGYRAGLFYVVFAPGGAALSNPQAVNLQQLPAGLSETRSATSITGDLDGVPVRIYARPLSVAGETQAVLVVGQSLVAEEAARNQLLLIVLAGAVVGLVLSFAGAWFVSGRALVPIEHAFQRQQEFVADASHELRTPLTILHSAADMLDDRSDEPARGNRALVDEIRQEIVHMERLTRDLLTLARSDRGELQLSLGRVDLGVLAHDLARRVALLAQRRGVAVEVQVIGGPAVVEGDPDRLQQVGLIVLDNALQHTPSGGVVQLVVERREEAGVLRVDDSGEGIPPEHLSRIFERFHRVDPSRARSTGGAGLGLAIARTLIVAHGGRIAVTSRPTGGTRVTIHLPLADAASDEVQLAAIPSPRS